MNQNGFSEFPAMENVDRPLLPAKGDRRPRTLRGKPVFLTRFGKGLAEED